ncbi:MAG TPA: glycine cleavage system protein GcvH [Polyangiaceae bacterium]|jgi:glycine cleavage system H protein|nr:MAG: Glycine cleavage system H protein [Deltaproteobacteria bacterium ADurb.Bin207]HNS96033.1 glycine cleavage system protein GcvH [Polyangiaceae bacterium]HNZ22352.1 glycine cleavage system protein GcvH [Polyangiaceae bacterium]HOE49076.1 glycine cleavage system protein GcvH [Polyangiaceae bacterium]HOH00021.1 glycine cleavage system protein GcvH [Polyangiaceae bacterium]
MSTFPNDRRYTVDHEWAKQEGGSVVIGVSSFAVEQLGDITLVSIDASVGDHLEAGKAFGTIESVKTLSDLLAPISGILEAVNGELEDSPETINDDCYGKGWMIKIKPASSADLDKLMDDAAYETHVKSSPH